MYNFVNLKNFKNRKISHVGFMKNIFFFFVNKYILIELTFSFPIALRGIYRAGGTRNAMHPIT